MTDVTIDYPGSDLHPELLVFGVESIGQAVTVTLYSSVGRATIVRTATAATRCVDDDSLRVPSSALVRRESGFTMIEVLVALAIIAVALAASLRAVGMLANDEADVPALARGMERR